MQFLMKARFGKEQYKEVWKNLILDKECKRRVVRQHKVANVGKGKRTLQEATVTMVTEKAKGKRKTKQRRKKRMTYVKMQTHFAKPEHGGYPPEQLKSMWQAKADKGPPSDKKGIPLQLLMYFQIGV